MHTLLKASIPHSAHLFAALCQQGRRFRSCGFSTDEAYFSPDRSGPSRHAIYTDALLTHPSSRRLQAWHRSRPLASSPAKEEQEKIAKSSQDVSLHRQRSRAGDERASFLSMSPAEVETRTNNKNERFSQG